MKSTISNLPGSLLLIILVLGICVGCSLKKPTSIDGNTATKIVVIDTTGTLPIDPNSGISPVNNARVRFFSTEYNRSFDFRTNEQGEILVADILASHYRIAADKIIPAEYMLSIGQVYKDAMMKGSVEIDICEHEISRVDTIKMDMTILSSIVINEIYYCGPANSGLYYSDQFIELYNASDSVQYLDGLVLCRAAQTPEYVGRYAEVYYVYQFPGNGNEHAIRPGEFVVIAQDAIDHIGIGGAQGSVDLSGADWEFYNQLGNDLDNPDVPNLININPNKQVDFMINLSHNGVVLAKVEDINKIVFNDRGYILLNFSDVLDAVEYSGNPDASKEMDPRLDSGLAGRGIQRYSGKSTERENPETGKPGYDTNNSTFDFVTLYRPTPGYQHSAEDVIPPLF